MKKLVEVVAVVFLSASFFASCTSKNPVAGKKMSLDAGGMSVTYIFTENQFWLEGLDGLKMNYRYDKGTNAIIYTELDGSESVIDMSKLKEVK
ncbi:MAG: hypothetical protein IJP90_03360 [Treponema sp.]|nr:hypothetical protein [Treponema sp.]